MDIHIRKGETLNLTVTADDDTAQTVVLTVKKDGQAAIITQSANFSTVDEKRVATVTTNSTNHAVDDYKYMLKITYADGTVEKLPDANCDEDNCELPTFKICEALDA